MACDVTTAKGLAEILEAAGWVGILVNNAGGPQTGNLRDWIREIWIARLDANMLPAFELFQAVIDPMLDQKFVRIVNITSCS